MTLPKLAYALDAAARGLFGLSPYLQDRILVVGRHWIWTGSLNAYGYGRVRQRGVHEGAPAHKRVLEELVGPVPDGHEIDHLCLIHACVNPACLEVVTPAENNRRARAVGHGFAAFQSAKTHCPRGHALSPDNTYTYPRGGRTCRICKRAAARRPSQEVAHAI